jgi:OOP family OmpA-OmpF porin
MTAQTKCVLGGVIAMMGLAGVPTFAADGGNWYAGIGAGSAKYKDMTVTQIDAELAAVGRSGATTVDNSDTGWKLFGGYQIHRNFALEASYSNFGKVSANTILTVPGAGTAHGTWEGESWALSGLGILPVTEKISLMAKVGVHFWQVDYQAEGTGSGTIVNGDDASDEGSAMLYGLGLGYDLTRQLTMRAEWEHFNNVGDAQRTGRSDIDMWSVGVLYRF